jgi:ABC-type transport system substrate-binding protein
MNRRILEMKKTTTKVLVICLLIMLSTVLLTSINPVKSQGTLFHVTLMVPQPNPSRQAWSLVVQNSLKAAGIDADRVILDWDTIYARALTPDTATVGKTYDQGGFDMLFVGYAMGIDPDPFPLYDSTQFPPTGQNYNLWNNSENDRLGRLIDNTTDENQRLQYVKQWQELAYNEVPACTIFYTKEVVAFDPTALAGSPFEILHYPCWPRVEDWALNPSTTQTKVVLAQTGPAPTNGLNPWLTTSYYDMTVWGAVFDGLTQRNDTDSKQMVPDLATSWEPASDQKTWTVHLRQGATWQDGVEFNATDVKFSYESAMAADLASPVGSFVQSVIGSPDNIEIKDKYTVVFHLPKPYAYFVSSILDRNGYGMMIPWHVLKDIPYADWAKHTFNTGVGSYTVNTPSGPYTAYGPIGTGPYVYMGYDATTKSNKMVKYNNYWNKDALTSAGTFKIQEYYVQEIDGADAAVSSLKSGDVDVLDSQYHLETKIASIEKPWGDYISYDAFGVQEMGFNMQHPVFGTGVDTPLGKQDPSRAAEAARYVRQAISHLVARQDIIDSIAHGYGSPGLTTPITKVTAGYDTSLQPYSYDVNLAKALLANAGYNTGVAPTIGIWQQYGIYIVTAVVVVVVIAVGAVYVLRRRRRAPEAQPQA